MNAVLTVASLGLGFYNGESQSGIVCPACNGGATHEGSLHLRRENDFVFYRCYRASCNFAGRVRVSGTVELRAARAKRREFVTDPDRLTDEAREYLLNRYLLSDEEFRRAGMGSTTRYGVKGRVYIPTYRLDGTVRGYVARDISGEQQPKALSFKFRDDEPSLHWYSKKGSKSCVLVEDAFSALRCSSYLTSGALLGTELPEVGVDEVRRACFSEVFLALDKDATKKAVKLALRYRDVLPMTVVPLPKDLKDMGREELEAFVKENFA